MAQHSLALSAPTTLNACRLVIRDESVYNQDIGVTCPILAITLPGFNYSVEFDENFLGDLPFSVNLTACDLEVQSEGCGTYYNDLPDGIYVIKYSVSPNEIVFVEYNHLRMTKALLKLKEAYCDLDLGACRPDEETEKKLCELKEIESYLDAAKSAVEICHDPNKGMTLYEYALSLLDKFTCTTCQSAKTKY